MTFDQAILRRISNRKYLDIPLSQQEQALLNKAIDRANRESGLHARLVCGAPEAFRSLRKSYGMLSGVQNYIEMAGPSGDPDLMEKCGYYGQQLVLFATTMDLGTCWIGGTYDKDLCQQKIRSGDTLCCVIAVGPVAEERSVKEKLVRGTIQHKSKALSELARGMGDAPDWFMSGVASVQRAPSAMNRQPIRFTYEKGSVTAEIVEDGSFSLIDLGIAKYHFEIGAHGGVWTWGSPGTFEKATEEKSCGAVIWKKTETGHAYLLAQHGASHWSFPKGHVEGKETERETALREIREETGLEVTIDESFRQVVTYYPKPGVIKDVIFFIAQPTGGTEHAQEEEIRQLGWFTFEEAYPLVTFATDVEVLQAAEEYIQEKQS